MTLILLLIAIAAVVALALRPKAPPDPIVIYIDRGLHADEQAGGCLPTLMALVAIAVLIILLAG